jgi:mannose-6-phosphate isomerase-like protein (cupin superfamily)
MKKLLPASLGVLVLLGAGYGLYLKLKAPAPPHDALQTLMSYHGNIIRDAQANENFRRVVFTGQKSQLVVMRIPPGGEVGAETHNYTEQTLFFLSGVGEGEFDGKTFPIGSGDVVVVTAGTEHNFRNTGTTPLKLYTVYAPPNHIDGRVHATKADADADAADEAIGESAPPQ